MKDNKKLLLGLALGIILIVIVVVIIACGKSTNEEMNDLKISYKNGKEISFNNFKRDFQKEVIIVVENTSKENKTYSLEWVKVENELKKQNAFLYEIKCTGDRCATLGKSQVPVASSKVYTQVLIEPGKTQSYNVLFEYKGSEKDAKFRGTLQVYSEKIDKKKLEEKEKAYKEKLRKELKNN